MSESVGIIGQGYENRKTRRAGVLVERDEAKKTLRFLDNATGEPFEVSEASFRSNWRKSKEEVAETVAESVAEAVAKEEAATPVSDSDAIQDFIDIVGKARDIHFTANPFQSDVTELLIDRITALYMKKDDGGVRVVIVPDLYTYSSIKEHVSANTLHFNAENHLAVSFIADFETFGEVLQSIKQAAIEINLYGYTAD